MIFIYNPYLLITSKDNHALGIIRMQIDNTLIFRNIKFLIKKQIKINKAGFLIEIA